MKTPKNQGVIRIRLSDSHEHNALIILRDKYDLKKISFSFPKVYFPPVVNATEQEAY
tara:strand:- start:190 stop:360 length:171 start_codon:yes stop_codon:yes gene_type:complete